MLTIVPSTHPSEHRVSPSQFKKHDRCALQWYYEYRTNEQPISRGSGEGAKLGKAMHKRVEDWYNGQLQLFTDKPQRLAELLIPYLPVPARSELRFGLLHGDVLLNGIIDVLAPGLVIDLKSSSDAERYAPTDYELAADWQAIMYGVFALVEDQDLDSVSVQFRYVDTKRERLGPTPEVTFRRTDLPRLVAKLVDKANELCDTEQPPPGNTDACGDFGGCPYAHICPETKRGGIMSMFDDVAPESVNDTLKRLFVDAHAAGDCVLMAQVLSLLLARGVTSLA